MTRFNVGFQALFAFILGLTLVAAAPAGDGMIKPDAVPAYQPKHYPFGNGEKEIYRATWNGMIAVATAEVHTKSAVVDGRKVLQVRIDAKTSPAMDLFWKMRDTISSTFDAKALAPSRFTFNQRENSRVIDTEARFDHGAKRWSVNRKQAGKKTRSYQFDSENTLDPITAVYLARSTDFNIGDKLYFKVFGGRYQYLLELFVDKKESVALSSGRSVEAYRIIPRVQNITKRGYAKRLNEAAIWISADERRVPVKLSSKIVFGSVHLELVEEKLTESAAGATRRPAS